jgi:hypothetical protein
MGRAFATGAVASASILVFLSLLGASMKPIGRERNFA